MRSPILLVTAATISALLIGAGCGGGGDDTTTVALTKAEFIKRGDAICKRIDQQQEDDLVAYVEAHPEAEKSVPAQEAALMEAGLPPIQVEAEELAALGAPEGDEEEIDAIVDGIEDGLEKTEEEPFEIASPDGPFAEVNRLAAEYGFKECSEAF